MEIFSFLISYRVKISNAIAYDCYSMPEARPGRLLSEVTVSAKDVLFGM